MDELELFNAVTLASGKSFPCDYLATGPMGYLFVAVLSRAPGVVAAAFADNTETSRIRYGDYELTGYSIFVNMAREAPGRYKIALRKPYVGEED